MQGSISEQVWLHQMMLEPIYRFSYGHYPDFDTWQNDLGLKIAFAKTTLSLEAVRLDRDVESLEADQTRYACHSWLSYPLGRGCYLTLKAGWGEQDWWVNPTGFIVDTTDTITSYYGANLSLPVSENLALNVYYQMGYEQHHWRYLGNIGLNLEY